MMRATFTQIIRTDDVSTMPGPECAGGISSLLDCARGGNTRAPFFGGHDA